MRFTSFDDIACTHLQKYTLSTSSPFLFLECTCILSPIKLSILLSFYVSPLYSIVIVLSLSMYLPSLSPSTSPPHCFRYFFPPLDLPRAGTRYGHLLPPSSLIEHCDAEPIQPQQQPLPHRHSSRALLPLPEAEGQWYGGVLAWPCFGDGHGPHNCHSFLIKIVDFYLLFYTVIFRVHVLERELEDVMKILWSYFENHFNVYVSNNWYW